MKIPVIIPAYNEQEHIERTLSSLPADLVEPIVAVNGTSDGTAEIALAFGATVFEIEDQGKMLAIQNSLRHIGGKALDPLILLDADARPIFPRKWPERMTKKLHESKLPSAAGGPIWYIGQPIGELSMRSAYRAARAARLGNSGNAKEAVYYGPNMAISIKDKKTLEKVLEIPNYWPGEDKALGVAITEEEGIYYDVLHPFAAVWNPISPSLLPLRERRKLTKEQNLQQVIQRYVDRGPEGSVPYK